ncbi:MAG: hypothetical protein U0792_08695 [Gemmataceae bacterium]
MPANARMTWGGSLSHWDCAELARQLIADEVVDSVFAADGATHPGQPQTQAVAQHLWLSPKVPRDAEFCKRVKNICTLYTRKLAPHERVLCVDEDEFAARTRLSPTLAAQPGPVRVEHEVPT